MRKSIKAGLSFGTTSGIITTLGLIVGIGAGTNSVLAVLGGILSIAISDGLSESMSMHVSKRCECNNDPKYVMESTLSTLFAKFFVTLSFAIPVLLMGLQTALIVDIIWGLFLLTSLSYAISEYKGRRKARDILEHLAIAAVAIVISHLAGSWIHTHFS